MATAKTTTLTFCTEPELNKGRPETVTQHVVSKQRVMDHGEVYTREREVNAMLDLVQRETRRIESRFLEPACGTGNFLHEVLRRKLDIVESRYRKSQTEYERYAFLAVSSIYGIDILADNIETCRARLFDLVQEKYTELYKTKTKQAFFSAVRFVLARNILWGDALTLKTPAENPEPIVFAEWALVNTCEIKRRDYKFRELLQEAEDENDLLSSVRPKSDEGETVFIPKPVKDYPLVNYLEVADAD